MLDFPGQDLEIRGLKTLQSGSCSEKENKRTLLQWHEAFTDAGKCRGREEVSRLAMEVPA